MPLLQQLGYVVGKIGGLEKSYGYCFSSLIESADYVWLVKIRRFMCQMESFHQQLL